MAPIEYVELGTYVFSGKFPIPLFPADFERARVVYADIDVVRDPTSPFFSEKTNPPTSFYGTICAMQSDYVVKRIDITQERQRIYLHGVCRDDQIIYALRCYDAIATQRLIVAVAELGGSLGSAPVGFSEDLTAIGLLYDELKFKCWADTALKVTIGLLDVLNCDENYPGESPPPPPPPSRPRAEKYPPGEPVPPEDYSPPPDGTDPFDWVPFPGDGTEEPPDLDYPIGDACVEYACTIRAFNRPGDPPEGTEITLNVWAVIESFVVEPEPGFPPGLRAGFVCAGISTSDCIAGQFVTFASGLAAAGFTAEVVSIEPV